MTLALNSSSVQKSGKSLASNLDSEFKNLDPDLQQRIIRVSNLSNKDFCSFYNRVIEKAKLDIPEVRENNGKDVSSVVSYLIFKVNQKSESSFFYESFEKIAIKVLSTQSTSKISLDEEIAKTNTKTKSHLTKLQEKNSTTNKENPKLRF
jgi:predicted phage tail protein